MKDGEGFVWLFVILIFGVFILAAWMLYKMADGIYRRPQIILQLALLVTFPIWLPPILVAWFTLTLKRNLIVRVWHHLPNVNAGFYVVFWATILPVLMVAEWLGIAYDVWTKAHLPEFARLLHIFPLWPDVVVAYMVLSVPMLVGAYFYLHYKRPPKHPNWAYFIAAEEQMLFETRLTLLRLKTGLRLIAGR